MRCAAKRITSVSVTMPRKLPVTLQLSEEAAEAATSGALSGRTDLPPFEHIAESFRARVRELGDAPPPTWDDIEQLDYVRLVDEEHEQRRARRKQGMS